MVKEIGASRRHAGARGGPKAAIGALAAAAAVVAVGMSGCAQLNTVWNAATGATVPMAVVVVGGNVVDGAEKTATNYVKACTPPAVSAVPCNDAAIQALAPALKLARKARNDLEAFKETNGANAIGAAGLKDALTKAIANVSAILTQYGIGGAK